MIFSCLSACWFSLCGCALASWLLDSGVIFRLEQTSTDKEEKSNDVNPLDETDCAKSIVSNGHVATQRLSTGNKELKNIGVEWEEMKVPKVVNSALDSFFETLLESHIHNWYKKISEDDAFTDDLRWNIRHFVALLAQRVTRVDLTQLILRKLLPAGVAHFDKFLQTRLLMTEANSIHGGEHNFSEEILPPNMKLSEQRTLDHCRSLLHKGMFSREAEIDYLR